MTANPYGGEAGAKDGKLSVFVSPRRKEGVWSDSHVKEAFGQMDANESVEALLHPCHKVNIQT